MTIDIAGLVEQAKSQRAPQGCFRRRLTGDSLKFMLAVEEEIEKGVSFSGMGIYRGLRETGFAVEKTRVLDHLKERCDCEH